MLPASVAPGRVCVRNSHFVVRVLVLPVLPVLSLMPMNTVSLLASPAEKKSTRSVRIPKLDCSREFSTVAPGNHKITPN